MKFTKWFNFKKPEPLDTVNINDLNYSFDMIDEKLKETEEENKNLSSTFKELIINAGNSNAEIVDARVDKSGSRFEKLGDRLDNFDSHLAEKAKQVDLEIERARIDEFLKGTIENTDNAETADIRIGANGKTYRSAGEAVREQVRSAQANIEKVGHKNLDYPITWIANEYIDNAGAPQPYTGWERSDFITISKGEKMLLIESEHKIKGFCCFYDVNNNKVSSFSADVGDTTVFIPDNAVKFRVSKPKNKKLEIRNQLYDGFYSKCAVLNLRNKIEIVNSSNELGFTITIPKDTGLSLYHHSNNMYFKEDCILNFVKPSGFEKSLSWNVIIDISTMILKAVPYYGKYILKPNEYMLFTLYIKGSTIITSLPDSYYKTLLVDSDLDAIKDDVGALKEDIKVLKDDVGALKGNGNTNSSENGILEFNTEANVGYLLRQSIRAYNDWTTHKYPTKVLSLAIITDIHGDKENLEKFIEFTNVYSKYITDKVCLGDMVNVRFIDDFSYWHTVKGSEKILNVIGNHDVWREDSNVPIDDKTLVYNKYIASNISKWGVVQPPNAQANGLNYYYKDYASSSIRVIFLDDNYYDDLQHNWFVSTLNEARAKGYHVLVCEHQQPTKVLKSLGSNFETLDYDYSKLVTNKRHQDRINAINDFIGNGGTFISWLSGDSHFDKFGVYEGTNGKQLSLVFENASCSGYWGDSERIRGKKSQDSFNFVSIDTHNKLIKVIRIGNNTDRYLRSKNTICYNYATHAIISQS